MAIHLLIKYHPMLIIAVTTNAAATRWNTLETVNVKLPWMAWHLEMHLITKRILLNAVNVKSTTTCWHSTFIACFHLVF